MNRLTVYTDDGKPVLDVEGLTDWNVDTDEDTGDARIEYTERSGKKRIAVTNMYYLITSDNDDE